MIDVTLVYSGLQQTHIDGAAVTLLAGAAAMTARPAQFACFMDKITTVRVARIW